MMIIAKQSHVRCGQQKLRDVARAVKHLPVTKMRLQLSQMNKEPARRILETLDQAIANASHNFNLSEDKLKLEEMLILRGPHYKRFRAVSRGMAHSILKRTSHISITLATIDETLQKEEVKQESKAEDTKTAKPKVKPTNSGSKEKIQVREIKPKSVAVQKVQVTHTKKGSK